MKKVIVIAIIVFTIAAGAFAATQLIGGPADISGVVEAAETNTPEVVAPQRIVVDGRVVPVQQAELSLAAGGIVSEVLVQEGAEVEAGQTLLRLESAQQKAAVAQAEAQLRRAEAQLAELNAGPRIQELTQAEASLQSAQAQLNRIKNGPLPEDIDAAEAALAEARASLQKVREGTSEDQLIAARTDLANAQAQVRKAQSAYDRIAGSPNAGAKPEAVELELATNEVIAAQARLDDLNAGASAADIAEARARVRQAQAQLDALQATNPADVEAAEADVLQAQAQLDLLKAGSRNETIAAAMADVAAAQATLDEAMAALDDTELRAPFAGTIAAIDANVGEQVTNGNPVIRLADLNGWEIETEDLTEFDVVKLQAGMPATITYDAIPDLTQEGIVKFVKPIGEDKRGDIVYTVVVEPSQSDERLLWNLTAVVTLEPATR